jgi:uncharacterized protein DUF4410
MRTAVFVAVLSAAVMSSGLAARQTGSPVKTIEDGVLDEIALYAQQPGTTAATPVVIRFTATDSDLGTGGEGGKDKRREEAKTIQEQGPKMLADAFAAKLKELGPYTNISSGEAAADALVIEGKFTTIDPGSRAKRYFVGFGAGKSVVEVSGTVKMGDKIVATFKQKRLGVMGNAGGDSLDKLSKDTRKIGEDIAAFVSRWTKGESLK